jgi:cytoskeletal protein CcmA (bactofilin family)
MADTNPAGTLLVGEGVFMKGTMKVPGQATIDGKIEGTISADTIYITANGAIKGHTTADHIRVGGELTDTTVANKTLVVESVGVIAGSITYAELEIKKGGSLQGSIFKVKDGVPAYEMPEVPVAQAQPQTQAQPARQSPQQNYNQNYNQSNKKR